MRSRFYLIYNSGAGTSRTRLVRQLLTALAAAGATVTQSTATTAEEARSQALVAAHSGQYDALIACGGDGTVRQAAAAAAGTSCPVAAFMLGTGNVLAHELGLPRDAVKMARLAQTGPTLSVQMAMANAEPFLLMAGAGFDGRVISHLDHRIKQRIAKAAFVPATLKALSAPIDALDIEIDGRTHTGVSWAIVTSSSCYGGAFKLTNTTSLRQQGLVAILFNARRKADLVRLNVMIARGQIDNLVAAGDTEVMAMTCNHVQITSATDVPVQIDGDAFGTTPLSVDANGPRVSLIVPD